MDKVLEKPTSQSNRITSLDGCRGIFALILVFYHANNNTILTSNIFVRQAFLFVDYFFVLSGFVLCYNYTDRIQTSKNFKNFVFKRFIRLYPLFFYTTFVFGMTLFFAKHSELLNSKDSYKGLLLASLDTLSLMSSTPIFGDTLGINYPSWSISAEIIASLFFGLGVLAFKKKVYYFFGTCLIVLILFFFRMDQYIFDGDYGFARGVFCFLLGYFVFLLLKSKKFDKVSFGNISEFIFLVFLIVMLKIAKSWKYELSFLIFPFIFSLGVLIFARGTGFITNLLNSNIFQILGTLSFSIYLNHALILIIFERLLFSNLGLPKSSLYVNGAYLLISIVSTIIYSIFTHKVIEVGFSKRLNKIFLVKK